MGVAGEFEAAGWSSDWQDALGEGIDVVVNLTPAPTHGEINLAAVAAGKHLYSEKPVARDRVEGNRIADAAAASGSVVVAAPSVMVFPQVRRAAELLTAGLIGPVRSVRAHGTAPPPPWDGYDSDLSPFFSAEVGPLSDMGVYPLHAITGLLGPADRVAAMSARTRNSFTVADGPYAGAAGGGRVRRQLAADLRLAAGALATVQSSFCIRQPAGPDLELNGERGTIAISLIDGSHPVRVLHRRRVVRRAGRPCPPRRARPPPRRRAPRRLRRASSGPDCQPRPRPARRRRPRRRRRLGPECDVRRRVEQVLAMAVESDPVRMGIIGVGALTLRAVLPHLAEPDVAHLVRVTALCDPVDRPRPRRGGAVRRPQLLPDVEAMLADDTSTLSSVVSPIGLHYTHCRLALEAGKHVHVNKTMTTTVDEADHLIGLAAEGGLQHRRLTRRGAPPAGPAGARDHRVRRHRHGLVGDLRHRLRGVPRGRARAGQRGVRHDRPDVVLPPARRRPDVRHDVVRPAPADEHSRARRAGDGDVRGSGARARLRRPAGDDRGRRQHDPRRRFRRLVVRRRLRNRRRPTQRTVRRLHLLRHARRARRRAAQRRSRSTSPAAS